MIRTQNLAQIIMDNRKARRNTLECWLNQYAREAMAKQRQMCADAIKPDMDKCGIHDDWQEIIGQACIEATGESDE